MIEILLYVVITLAAFAIVLLIAILTKKQTNESSPEILARLASIEQTGQSALVETGKSAGGLEGVSKQIRDFTQTTAVAMEVSRQAVDEKLTQTLTESRSGREELAKAFQAVESKLEQRLSAFDVSLSTRFEGFQQSISARIDESSKALLANLAQAKTDAALNRKELTDTLTAFKSELNVALAALTNESLKARETLAESSAAFEMRIQERFEALTAATRLTLDSLKADVVSQLSVMSTAMKDQLDGNGNQLKNQFTNLQESVGQQLQSMALANSQNGELLRVTLNERLISIQTDNTNKLEEMRKTVDEKLHATLEQRLGDSFKLVSERLELVHTGLGEMKTLAGSVGDLKRVMTNVRARGTWGEVQLGAIIESVMTSGQYSRNVKTIPGSNDVVEFAIKFPGNSDDTPLWLPIDSKYPVEQYQRLLDAYDAADKALILTCGNAFESSLRAEAKKISSKYVSPPHTTDFAILFVPTEGLFAEVMRRPGLADALQTEFHVLISGPANLAAMLSSFQMGFRTLAIEKRSSEVWGILSSVKTEFQKFGDIVDATKKSIDAAANKFTELGRRSRAIKKHLQDVEELPAGAPSVALGHNFVAIDLDEDVESDGALQ